ncbi:helix-turn-helix domain-containing protein [Acinetobacter sp. ANC 4648]|uniref:helix-turn-helix domain-containing protein n=1 Tax=Acinetobacter sp. ANC 4648 TaxID=1977875 RepID=UPI000A359857|nr:helix-turn-helix domain-containing protein [Acinetobacter sp. ANC 4648]OTG81000.1 hypothetical protein B9T27_11050 [Acinetobacter sp. ANC 4648]
MNELSIAELVKRTGIPSSTIRYYEHEGLIRSIGRKGLQRIFHIQVVDQLLLIGLGKQAGFTLKQLHKMLQNKSQPIDKNKLEQRASEIDAQIQQLDALRQSLRHVAQCQYENPLECSQFQKLLRNASFAQAENKKAIKNDGN